VRRATPSFTVEIRRKSKQVTSQSPDALATQTQPRAPELFRPSRADVDAALQAKQAEAAGTSAEPSHTKGRILPSLLEEEPPNRLLRDSSSSLHETAPTPTTPSQRRESPRKGSTQTSVPSKPGVAADVLAANKRASLQANDGAPFQRTTAAQLSNRNAASPKGHMKETPRKAASTYVDQNRVAPFSLDGQNSPTGVDAVATSPSNVQEGSSRGRKRHIMGRYVVGDELKPGERWKRLLRWKR
jgi:hypothetical protein